MVYAYSMHRRTILNLIPATLLIALVPWKAKAREAPRKTYLGCNEPYDRSLVRIEHGREGCLSYEIPNGDIYYLMLRQEDGDLGKLHQALWAAVKFRREYGPVKHLSLSRLGGVSVMLQCKV